MRATQHDGAYPRPMLRRERWPSLDGPLDFTHDDADEGLTARWFHPPVADPVGQRIEVPYPLESPASGIGVRGLHPVVWYHRRISQDVMVSDREEGSD